MTSEFDKIIRAVSCAALLTLGTACFDTHEEFDKFVDRSESFRVAPVAGECLGPVDLSGRYLLGVAVTLGPDKPIRFDATFEVDQSTTPWTLEVHARTLSVADSAPIGDEITATSPIADDGTFRLDFGTITVLTAANPIVALDVVATFVMEGCTSTETFACGLVSGAITSPIAQSIDGSTWALVAAPEGTPPGTLATLATCPTSP